MSTDVSATASEASAIFAVSLDGARAFGSSWDVVLLLMPQCSAQAAAAADCTNGNDFPSQQCIEQAIVRAQSGAITAAKTTSVAARSARRKGRVAACWVCTVETFGLIARVIQKATLAPGAFRSVPEITVVYDERHIITFAIDSAHSDR